MRSGKRDLSDVSNCPETSRPNERTNERVEFACKEGCRSPFEKRSSRTRSRTLDVYLTRSNLIKNLIKSDFWAAPESVPNQPRRGNKTREEFSVFVPRALASRRTFIAPSDINVSRVSNLTADFSPILVHACEPIWNCNANNDEIV